MSPRRNTVVGALSLAALALTESPWVTATEAQEEEREYRGWLSGSGAHGEVDSDQQRQQPPPSSGTVSLPTSTNSGGAPDYQRIYFESAAEAVDRRFVSPCADVEAAGPLAVDLGLDGQVLGCFAADGEDAPVAVAISLDAVYDATPWPATEVKLNPRVFGVVNLDTWAWHDPDAARTISTTVETTDLVTGEPVSLEVSARLVGWCHRFEDDRGERPRFVAAPVACPSGSWSTEPGEDHEGGGAAEHVYEEMGFFTATVEQRWEGEAVLSGPSPQRWSLGPVTLTHQREYQVNEIIGVLTG